MSSATNLAAGEQTDPGRVRARLANRNDVASESRQGGVQANSLSRNPAISVDGGFVALVSFAGNLGPATRTACLTCSLHATCRPARRRASALPPVEPRETVRAGGRRSAPTAAGSCSARRRPTWSPATLTAWPTSSCATCRPDDNAHRLASGGAQATGTAAVRGSAPMADGWPSHPMPRISSPATPTDSPTLRLRPADRHDLADSHRRRGRAGRRVAGDQRGRPLGHLRGGVRRVRRAAPRQADRHHHDGAVAPPAAPAVGRRSNSRP